jgi:hypothetical protein
MHVCGNAPDGLSRTPRARDNAKSDLRDIRVPRVGKVVSGTATVAMPWLTVPYNLPHLAVKGIFG